MWAGYRVHQLPHMGNTTTNRVESMHATLKSRMPASNITLLRLVETIHEWDRLDVSHN